MAGTGFIILAHSDLHRTAQLALALARGGGKVMVHVDAKCPATEFDSFSQEIAVSSEIRLSPRHTCTWGTYSLVRATLEAAKAVLEGWPGLDHVALLSGDTIPLLPVREIIGRVQQNPGMDFIESIPAGDGNWARGGLEIERFRYWFPLPWRSQRRWFDRLVKIQRRFGTSRKIPPDLTPHIGSQWWCLCAATLRAIISDPLGGSHRKFFRWSWIPDESYFQTLVRKHGRKIESQPFVLSEFDPDGLPRIFYDDHIGYLRGQDAFFARKVWSGAEGVYRHFLSPVSGDALNAGKRVSNASAPEPTPRLGLVMQGRFPADAQLRGQANSEGFDVIIGFDHVVPDFQSWLAETCAATVHGRLFGQISAAFVSGPDLSPGCLPGEPRLRDRDPHQFLRNLLWAQRDRRQVFLFDPSDNPAFGAALAQDTGARIHVLRQGWIGNLLDSGRSPEQTAEQALRWQAGESLFFRAMVTKGSGARLIQWPLTAFLSDPSAVLRQLAEQFQHRPKPAALALPDLMGLPALADYAHGLRNCGLPIAGNPNTHAAGDDLSAAG